METIRNASDMIVRFWGVRGSMPSAQTPAEFEEQVLDLIERIRDANPSLKDRDVLRAWMRKHLPYAKRAIFGGNTPCVEVRCGCGLIILDMGTGLHGLSRALMAETMKQCGLFGTILQSHLHWDHIQGFPFWSQLYLPRDRFNCQFDFFGGKEWDAQLELVLAGQMHPPVFPISFGELKQTGMQMRFHTVYNGWNDSLLLSQADGGLAGMTYNPDPTIVLARTLNHPQETFGFRIKHGKHTIAYTTDHEPYAHGIPRALLELVDHADVWITDCQYSQDEYGGLKGVQKMGWGHSFPEYIAEVAREAKPRKIVTFHHDPDASGEDIVRLAEAVAYQSGIQTQPAYEGLEYVLTGA